MVSRENGQGAAVILLRSKAVKTLIHENYNTKLGALPVIPRGDWSCSLGSTGGEFSQMDVNSHRIL